MKNAYVCLDIGSDSVKVAVCQLFGNKLNLLAASSIKSDGITKGLITNKEFAKNSVKKAIQEIQDMLGVNINKVILSIPNEGSECIVTKGEINLDINSIITGKEIENVLVSSAESIQYSDMEIINILPIDFEVDEELNINDPRGRHGNVLRSRVIVTLSPKANLYPLLSLLEELNIEVVDISLNGVGDINIFKTKQMSNEVGAVVNIGYDKTDISLYNKSIIIKNSTIDFGAKNIDGDISYIYKLNSKTSSLIKEKYALAHKRHASENEVYDVTNKFGDLVQVNQLELSEIVSSRLEEILISARKEINFLTKREVDYIIITGGTSSVADMTLLVKEVLGNIANVGDIKVLGVRNNKYSSVIGNIIYFINKLKLRNIDYSMLEDYDLDQVDSQNNLMNTINDTMLGKVFGYFFND